MRQRLGGVGLLLLAWVSRADAQVLTIGETLGRGKSAILFSDNVIYPGDGIPSLNIAYGMWARGVHRRFDLLLSGGETTTEGATQGFAAAGGNLHLVKAGRLAMSFFNIASVPFNHRDEACDVLLNSALVVSVPAGSKAFVYSGMNGLIPLGHRGRGIFTPPSARFNAPVGASYTIGAWGLWGEVDIGPLHAIGVGLTRTF